MTHKAKIILIFAVVYMLVSVAAFSLVTFEVDRVGGKLEERVTVVANRYAEEKKFSELNQLIEDTANDRDELGLYILSEKDTISFLAEVEKIGVEQGVVLETNSLNKIENKDKVDELEVSFSVAGDESLVMRMLDILESLPYESRLTSMVLNRGEVTDMDVKINLYLY